MTASSRTLFFAARLFRPRKNVSLAPRVPMPVVVRSTLLGTTNSRNWIVVRVSGAALRPLARRSPIAAESAARRGPRGPGPGLSCRGRLGRRDPPGGGGAAPPGARAAGPGRGRPPAGLSIHVLVLPHRRAVAATSPRLRRRRSERATLPAKAVCELIFIHLGTYPVDGTCCKTPIRPSSAATAPTPTKRPSPASPKSATRTSAAPRRARRPGRP